MTAAPTRPAPDRAPVALSRRAAAQRSSVIRDLLRHAERPGVLSLAGGLPAPEAFPVDRIAAEVAAVLGADGAGALQYAPTEGIDPLRELLAARAGSARRRDVAVDEVLVVSGSQQALDLLGRVLVDPGDVVVVDDPGYVGALLALRAHDAVLVGVPVDRDGLRTEELAARLAAGLRPRLCYTNPSFQNPTGAVSSPARRAELAALAERYGFLVVEDDPYGELWFDAPPPPPIAAATDRVLTLGTGSKLLAPGLRVGWAVGPREVVAAMAVAKQAVDLQTGTLAQRVAAGVLGDDAWLDGHLDRVRAAYAARAGALVAALGAGMPHVAVPRPRGGMFAWVPLGVGVPGLGGGHLGAGDLGAGDLDVTRLLPVALDEGVAYVPGSACAVDRPVPAWARLSFSTVPPELLAEAVTRLARACARARAGTP